MSVPGSSEPAASVLEQESEHGVGGSAGRTPGVIGVRTSGASAASVPALPLAVVPASAMASFALASAYSPIPQLDGSAPTSSVRPAPGPGAHGKVTP